MSPDEARRGRGGPPFRGHRGGRGRGEGFVGDPAGSFFGRGRQAGRGDIRAAILALLDEAPMHGYQIIQELDRRTEGVWKPSPGSVYPTLQHLEDEGLITGGDGGGKRIFTLTDEGRTAMAGRTAPWEDVGADVDAGLLDLREIARQVAMAVRQVAHAGTSPQVDAAKALLLETRRKLYRILADDPVVTTESRDPAGSDAAGEGSAPPAGQQ